MKKGTQKRSLKPLLLFGGLFLGIATVFTTVVVGSGSLFRTDLGTKTTGDQITAAEWNDVIAQLPGEFIGFSAASNGDPSAGGYDQADSICNAAHTGSRVCSMSELLKGVSQGTTAWNVTIPLGGAAVTPQAWALEGAPGYFAPVKDCNGWTDNSNSEYGSIFSFYLGKALILECDQSIPFACCK